MPEEIKQLTEENIIQLTQELEQVTKELETSRDAYIHLLADFDNYKKRTTKGKETIARNELYRIINSFSPIYVCAKIGASYNDEGVVHIFDKIVSFLKEYNVGIIDENFFKEKGFKFSEEYAAAIMYQTTSDISKDGKVCSVIEDGFIDLENNKVIKYANVTVGKFE